MKLAITVSNCGAAVNVGGLVDVETRVFDLTPEARTYLEENVEQKYQAVTLSYVKDQP